MIYMDADEQLDEKAKRALPRLLKSPATDGYFAPIFDYVPDLNVKVWDFPTKRALTYRKPWPGVESNLGLAEVRLGRARAGLERLRRAVQEEPLNGDIHDRLIQACCWLNLLEEAANAADYKLAVAPRDPQSFLRAASIHVRLEQRETATQILRVGLSLFPQFERLQRCYLELAGGNSNLAS